MSTSKRTTEDGPITILGIDQGRECCGWAVVRYDATVDVLCFGQANLATLSGRKAMRHAFHIAKSMGVVGYATEKPWYGATRETAEQAQGSRVNPLRLGQRKLAGQSQVLGVLAEMAETAGVKKLPAVPASSGKLALSGHGQASKAHMVLMAFKRFGVEASEHVADAIGVALGALRVLRAQRMGVKR